MKFILLNAALFGALLIAGCSTGSSAVSKNALVKIDKIDAHEEWRPSIIMIDKGGSVTWKNNSTVLPHSVISVESLFPPQTVTTGGNFTFTFTNSGTFTFKDTPNNPGITEDYLITVFVK